VCHGPAAGSTPESQTRDPHARQMMFKLRRRLHAMCGRHHACAATQATTPTLLATVSVICRAVSSFRRASGALAAIGLAPVQTSAAVQSSSDATVPALHACPAIQRPRAERRARAAASPEQLIRESAQLHAASAWPRLAGHRAQRRRGRTSRQPMRSLPTLPDPSASGQSALGDGRSVVLRDQPMTAHLDQGQGQAIRHSGAIGSDEVDKARAQQDVRADG
jgi:hypothetical protein